MEVMNFNTYDDLAETILEYYTYQFKLEYEKSITILAKYNVAKEVIKSLFHLIPELNNLELETLEISGYDKEFAITLTSDGISCEKAWHPDNQWHPAGYFNFEDDCVFVHEECSFRIINSLNGCTNSIDFSVEDNT